MADLTQIPAGVLAMLQQKLSTSAQIGAPAAGQPAPSSAPPPDITAAVQAAGSTPQPATPPPNITSFVARNPQAQNEVAGQIQQAAGGAPSAQPDPGLKPPLSVGQSAPDAPEQMGDAVDRLSAPVGAGAKAPALAPQPKPHTSLMSHILSFLQAAGVLGGGLAAAGDRQHGEEAVTGLQSAFQAQNAMKAKAAELQNVEIPKAQAYKTYTEGINPTKENVADTVAGSRTNVQGLKNTGALATQGLKNTGAMNVEQLKAAVALGKVTKVLPGLDNAGNPIMNAYNASGALVGQVPGALAPAAYLPKRSARDQIVTDANGNQGKVTMNSSSGVALPSPASVGVAGGAGQLPRSTGGTVTPKNGAPISGGNAPQVQPSASGGQMRPITDASGNQLHKPLSQEARKTISQVYTAQNLIDDIQPDLQSVVTDQKRGGNLADTAKIRSAWYMYKSLGLDPANVDQASVASMLPNIDPRLARIFPTIAMLQVVGAQPYLRGMRNFNYIKQVQAHIPDPEKDTPDLMLSKMQQMQHNLPGLVSAIQASEGIGQRQPQNAPALNGRGAAQPAPAGQPTHIINDANGNRIGTAVNGVYVPDKK